MFPMNSVDVTLLELEINMSLYEGLGTSQALISSATWPVILHTFCIRHEEEMLSKWFSEIIEDNFPVGKSNAYKDQAVKTKFWDWTKIK